jgi:hypothetical protein
VVGTGLCPCGAVVGGVIKSRVAGAVCVVLVLLLKHKIRGNVEGGCMGVAGRLSHGVNVAMSLQGSRGMVVKSAVAVAVGLVRCLY